VDAIGSSGPDAPTAAKLDTCTLVRSDAHTGHARVASRPAYEVSTSNVSPHD
jgi:hypothetical protein